MLEKLFARVVLQEQESALDGWVGQLARLEALQRGGGARHTLKEQPELERSDQQVRPQRLKASQRANTALGDRTSM
eukprot:1965825-Rhodomonas_salina.3